METEAFGRVLQRVVRERGTAILLVEHDMSLVMDICDYIYVLDFGQLVFEGTPAEVSASDIVRAAYLGVRRGRVDESRRSGGRRSSVMSDLALRLESVTGGYGDTTVLRDVSLEVPRGAVVALLGPNGAGKTTLLKMVSGVITPESGRIFRGDEDVTGARIHDVPRAVCATSPTATASSRRSPSRRTSSSRARRARSGRASRRRRVPSRPSGNDSARRPEA